MDSLKIGFIPLVDSASLIVAKELGFFTKNDLDVDLVREVSWSNIRDKLIFGEFDAAHLLAPMLVSTSLGLGSVKRSLVAGYSFGLNGNAVSMSNQLYASLCEVERDVCAKPELAVSGLKKVVEARKLSGEEKLRFAVVFPYSMHNYLLRHWLSLGNIAVSEDVDIVVVPPSSVVQALEEGLIDGYCVGEPWNTHAVRSGVGVVVQAGSEIWEDAPEKVLGVQAEWASQNEGVHRRLIKSLVAASEWIDDSDNYDCLVELLSLPKYVGAPVESIGNALKGVVCNPVCGGKRDVVGFTVPYKNQANYPRQQHISWIVEQMKLCGQVSEDIDAKSFGESLYLSELYQESI